VQAVEARDARLIAGATALVVLQAGMIAGLLLHWGRRRRAEQALKTNEAALRGSYDEIRTLAGRLLRAQEDERTRIARELHDDVSQSMATICLQIATLRDQEIADGDPNIRHALTRLHESAVNVADDIRALSHDLHPHVLHHIGLVAALAAHCDEMRSRYECDIRFSANPGIGHVPNDAALCLYRIAQEAISNSCRHAQAGRTTVGLARTGSALDLTVSDDGIGFDLDETRQKGVGLGLVSMDERVRLANGSLGVRTTGGRGTTVSVRIPVDQEARPHGAWPIEAGRVLRQSNSSGV
jgi:signal transduction histidine kinase